ncbi:hypothetical protein Btru_014883 [Bulinus truncatus]|nr:hypothetical protein Btru_014883 [Bulinus truncatus]
MYQPRGRQLTFSLGLEVNGLLNKTYLRSGKLSLLLATTYLRSGKLSLLLATTYLRNVKLYLLLAKTYLRSGKLSLPLAKTYLHSGKLSLLLAKTYLRSGKLSLLLANYYLRSGKLSLPLAKTYLHSGKLSLLLAKTYLRSVTKMLPEKLCQNNSDCLADECCQRRASMIVASRKRRSLPGARLEEGVNDQYSFTAARNKTCQKYTTQGRYCAPFDKLNGLCGCEPGTVCTANAPGIKQMPRESRDVIGYTKCTKVDTQKDKEMKVKENEQISVSK